METKCIPTSSELRQKIFAVKSELQGVPKNATNPFFNSQYFDINSLLEYVEPILRKHNLIVLQPIDGNSVHTVIVDVESGGHVSSSMPLPQINDPQKMGACVTYFRRFTLVSLLALQSVDDDGNFANNRTETLNAPIKVKMPRIGHNATLNPDLEKRDLAAKYCAILVDLPESLRVKYAYSERWDIDTIKRGIAHLESLKNNNPQ